MNDFRRTILWVVFGTCLILLWDRWQVYQGRPAAFFPSAAPALVASAPPAPAPNEAAAAAATVPPAAQQLAAPQQPAAAEQPAAPAAQAPASAAQRIEVRTDVYRLSFDTRGASLVGAQLLRYPSVSDDPRSEPIVLLDSNAARTYEAQTGLAGGALPNHLTPMTLVSPQRALADGQDSMELRFESEPAGGVQIVKTYTLARGSYAIGVRHEVRNLGDVPVHAQLYEQLVRDASPAPGGTRFYSTFTGPAFYSDEAKYQKVEFADIDKGKAKYQQQAKDGYVAMVQHYFASAWLLPDGTPRSNYVHKAGAVYAAGQMHDMGTLAPAASASLQSTLFVGPQDERVMQALSPNLDLLKDYGWLTILARPLFWLLNWLHSLLHNWGWAIVALVVIIKIAFYWLNHKAYASMAKMKAVNPKVQELRERYKDEPQKMQQEMMRIYREEKVNPLGGCLPILVQMPVFFALYWVLSATVEMRGAPWIGWVHDLSMPDPFFILPLLMAASSLLQVWLNPTPPDPMQAKMMWFMPIAFSVFFFFFPSGLVLYWLTNNILSIAQQWFINKRLGVT